MPAFSTPEWERIGTDEPDTRHEDGMASGSAMRAGYLPWVHPASREPSSAPLRQEPPWVDPPFDAYFPTIMGNLSVLDSGDGNNLYGQITCRQLNVGVINGPQAGSTGLQPSGDTSGAKDTAAINAAIAALPVRTLTTSPLATTATGKVILGAGNFYVNATINVPPWVILQGGGPGTIINSLASGDTFFQQNPVPKGGAPLFQNVFTGISGGFRDLLIDGTSAGASGVGLHIDSMPESLIVDGVTIQNFTGANAIGLWLSNNLSFTENYRIRALSINNTLGCRMEKLSGGSESFRYGDFWLHVVAEQGQSGMIIQGAHVYMGTFRLTGNYASSTTAGPANWSHLYLTPTSVGGQVAQIQSCHVIIAGEVDLGNANVPQTIIFGGPGNSLTQCTGLMLFQNSFAAASMNSAPFSLWGPIGGETTLQNANNQPSQMFLNGINTQTPGAVSTPGVGASGSPVTNSTNFDVMVYVNGTITSATKINGTAVGDTSVKSYYLPVGATITLTYSSAPAWVWLAV